MELYVGLLGNAKLEVLPLVELTFGDPDAGDHRIATYRRGRGVPATQRHQERVRQRPPA